MGVTTHSLERAVTSLALGGIMSVLESRDARHEESLGEFEHQFQLPFTGTARAAVVWASMDVTFDIPFVATEHRDSDLEVPQFKFGYAITSGEPVIVHACITAWDTEDNETHGATISIGLLLGDPNVEEHVVKGVAFLTFQGFGAPYDDEDEPDVESD